MPETPEHDPDEHVGAADASAPAWEQLAEEPSKWYALFERYRRMGPTRSVLSLYREEHRRAAEGRKGAKFDAARYDSPRELPGSWRRIVRAWAWPERAAAFDDYERQIEERSWADRRRASRQADWDLADRLRQRATQMLSLPVLKQRVEEEHYDDGRARTVTIIEPAEWTIRDAVAIAKAASDLAMRATGRDAASAPTLLADLSEFTDEELRQVRAGADPAEVLRRRESA